MSEVVLLEPTLTVLPACKVALRRERLPDSVRGDAVAREQLAAIQIDPAAFVANLDDPDARGIPIRLPDGSEVPRLPSVTRWIWDGEFCGSIGLRWQTGTSVLPPHVLGHIGYNVVVRKQGLGQAKRALAMMLPEARSWGLEHVELTSDPTIQVEPRPGVPGYEAVATCLASSAVCARTDGTVAWRPAAG